MSWVIEPFNDFDNEDLHFYLSSDPEDGSLFYIQGEPVESHEYLPQGAFYIQAEVQDGYQFYLQNEPTETSFDEFYTQGEPRDDSLHGKFYIILEDLSDDFYLIAGTNLFGLNDEENFYFQSDTIEPTDGFFSLASEFDSGRHEWLALPNINDSASYTEFLNISEAIDDIDVKIEDIDVAPESIQIDEDDWVISYDE